MKAIAILVACAVGQSPSAVSLPATIQATPGREVAIEAKTPGKMVRWTSLDPDLRLLPPDATGPKVWAIGCRPGRYRVLAWSAVGDAPTPLAECWVVVQGAPGPGPGPDPALEKVATKIREALGADPASGAVKSQQAATLAGVYEAVAEHIESGEPKTSRAVLEGWRRVARPEATGLPADALVGVRKAVAEAVAAVFGAEADDRALSAELRAASAALFRRIAQALEGV